MPIVRFPWDAQLVGVRRDVCPQAMWNQAACGWMMTDSDADAFLKAAQARMFFAKCSCTLMVDDAIWVLGAKRGTPYRL